MVDVYSNVVPLNALQINCSTHDERSLFCNTLMFRTLIFVRLICRYTVCTQCVHTLYSAEVCHFIQSLCIVQRNRAYIILYMAKSQFGRFSFTLVCLLMKYTESIQTDSFLRIVLKYFLIGPFLPQAYRQNKK